MIDVSFSSSPREGWSQGTCRWGFPQFTQPAIVAREGTAKNKRKILAGFLLSFLSTSLSPPVPHTRRRGDAILTCHLNSELCWEALPPASPPDAPLETPFLLYFTYLRAPGAGVVVQRTEDSVRGVTLLLPYGSGAQIQVAKLGGRHP